ncbi:MAG: hypothetical protein A2Y62_01865 [Candidatus Fischerbacteria bacterium RBG_13_37_8]|uniref:O-antigen ligase-related domain-containing protein n=1 Tax=Candidatus Fischerbacteria bacterium RBG_13_37_8 TaxID=1817863 RepID=A0A1F5VDW8_9BACT|nr:MAG: hypothetical protein A2Y62_01865 [Candidatus Fischerbacteria bacterium RBG_13_37_8]
MKLIAFLIMLALSCYLIKYLINTNEYIISIELLAVLTSIFLGIIIMTNKLDPKIFIWLLIVDMVWGNPITQITLWFPFLSINTIIAIIILCTAIYKKRLRLYFKEPLTYMLLIFYFYAISSILWMPEPTYTSDHFKIFSNVIFYFLVLTYFRNSKSIERGSVIIIIACTILALWGIIFTTSRDQISFSNRTSIQSLNAVYFAFSCWLALPFLLGKLHAYYTSRKKIILLFVGSILIYAVIGSRSRGVIIVLFFTLLVYLLLNRRKISAFKTITLFVTSVTILFIYLSAQNFSDLIEIFPDSFYDIFNPEARKLSGRQHFYYAAINMFKEKPLFGWGFQQFPEYWGSFTNVQVRDVIAMHRSSTHSVYLQTLAELGITGLLFYISLFIISYYNIYIALRFSIDIKNIELYSIALIAAMGITGFAIHSLIDNSGWYNRTFMFFMALSVILKKEALKMHKQR